MSVSENRDGTQIPPSLDEGFHFREGLKFCASSTKTEVLMHVCKEILVVERGQCKVKMCRIWGAWATSALGVS